MNPSSGENSSFAPSCLCVECATSAGISKMLLHLRIIPSLELVTVYSSVDDHANSYMSVPTRKSDPHWFIVFDSKNEIVSIVLSKELEVFYLRINRNKIRSPYRNPFTLARLSSPISSSNDTSAWDQFQWPSLQGCVSSSRTRGSQVPDKRYVKRFTEVENDLNWHS